MSFASLKKQSKLGSYTQKLIKEVEKMNTSGGGGADERFWKPEMDKTGVGSAVTVTIHSSTSDALYGSCTFNSTE